MVVPAVIVEPSPRSNAEATSGDRDHQIPDWLQAFTEGVVEGESESSRTAGETSPKTPPPHIPARPSNKPGRKHNLFAHFRKAPIVKSSNAQQLRGLHIEGILEVEKTRYHKQEHQGDNYSGITTSSMKRTNLDCNIDMR